MIVSIKSTPAAMAYSELKRGEAFGVVGIPDKLFIKSDGFGQSGTRAVCLQDGMEHSWPSDMCRFYLVNAQVVTNG